MYVATNSVRQQYYYHHLYAAVLEVNFTKSFYKVLSEGTLDICLEAVGLAQIDPGDRVPLQLKADHPGI